MVGYNTKTKAGLKKFLFDLSFAEREGIGMWYEYLAKRRIYTSKNPISVLVCGLPEKYGFGVDNLLFASLGAKLTVVDDRPDILAEFKKIALDFLGENNKVEIIKVDDLANLSFAENQFDLVCSSEVLQRFDNYLAIIGEMNRVSSNRIVFFVSNAGCYAHPKISGLNSYDLKKLKTEIEQQGTSKIVRAGYADIPPWPSGINVSQNEKINQGKMFELGKAVFKIITPMLARLEILYPQPLRKLMAHFIYFDLKKK